MEDKEWYSQRNREGLGARWRKVESSCPLKRACLGGPSVDGVN